MINVLTYAYGTTYTQHKHYIYKLHRCFFCCRHYAKPSLCTTVYIYICICNNILIHMPIFLRANMYIHICIYKYINIYMIWYCACHMVLCMSYDMYTFNNSAHCFIDWIVYNLVSGTPMTGTFSFQAIAVAPRGQTRHGAFKHHRGCFGTAYSCSSWSIARYVWTWTNHEVMPTDATT